MGYTHYFSQRVDCPFEQWQVIAKQTHRLLQFLKQNKGAYSVFLGDWQGRPGSQPEINEQIIRFNGIEPFNYETFCLSRIKEKRFELDNSGYAFNFCKTQYRPYQKRHKTPAFRRGDIRRAA